MVKKSQKTFRVTQKKVIAIMLAALIIAGIGYIAFMQKVMQVRIDELSTIKIGMLILEAEDSLNSPILTDAQTGDRYIPEARLRLPANSFSANRLKYFYSAKSGDTHEEVRLSSVAAVNAPRVKIMSATSIENLFEAVAQLQACSRGFRLTFEKIAQPEEDLTLVFEKNLKDGRLLSVNAEDSCNTPDYFDLEYLKQIDSY
ncbi:hypothetical protein H0X10_03635 [Candidatus Saccharibacteria bacterium]|nr:hypothetical protein [Candidatus Saccharibacteria bacterium]